MTFLRDLDHNRFAKNTKIVADVMRGMSHPQCFTGLTARSLLDATDGGSGAEGKKEERKHQWREKGFIHRVTGSHATTLYYTTLLPLLQWAADADARGGGGRATGRPPPPTPSRLRHSALPDAIRSMPEAIAATAAAAAFVVTYKCVRP